MNFTLFKIKLYKKEAVFSLFLEVNIKGDYDLINLEV